MVVLCVIIVAMFAILLLYIHSIMTKQRSQNNGVYFLYFYFVTIFTFRINLQTEVGLEVLKLVQFNFPKRRTLKLEEK